MSETDYCELCDLPKSQCIHGRPPPPPAVKPVKAAKPRTSSPRSTTPKPLATAPTRVVPRRWTPPEALKPLILAVLHDAGGELDADAVFDELQIRLDGKLLAGDEELTPEGELRWRYAARRARVALLDEGLMVKSTPGVWKLA